MNSHEGVRSGRNWAAILDALGDPIRRLLYERLSRDPSNVTRLAKGVSVTRSAVSHHLRVLKDAGLVAAERSGRSQIYAVCPDGLRPLATWIEKKAELLPCSSTVGGGGPPRL